MNSIPAPAAPRAATASSSFRWRQLWLGLLCMIMIANLQYGWTLFVLPLHEAHGWTMAGIQFAFTLFVALETWGTPFNGWCADRLGTQVGPRTVIGIGGVLVALGWGINACAATLPMLYVGGALSGLGSGAVYCTVVGSSAKWFQDRRGLAVGIIAGGFGAGAALTVIPIRMVIAASGYASAFLWFGLLQGGVIVLASQFIRDPKEGEAPAGKAGPTRQSAHSYTTAEMLRNGAFWVLYLLDLLMCAGGLIVTAYLAPIATSFQVSTVDVLLGATALSTALIFSNVMNGVARPFFGWVSDRIGVIPTMGIAFCLGAVSYFMLSLAHGHPWAFILCVGMVFFSWGEIFSLFPALCTDLFGSRHATTNLSVLYTAKGAAAFLVPLGGMIVTATGNWTSVLYLATGINLLALVLVFGVLRPAIVRLQAREAAN